MAAVYLWLAASAGFALGFFTAALMVMAREHDDVNEPGQENS